MLVQPLRTATAYKVDRARKRATSGNRAQTLNTDFNNRGSTNAPDTTLLTLPSSYKACSGFTHVAACTLSRSPYFVTRYPKASDISSPPCLLRLLPAGAMPGGICAHRKSAAFSRRTPEAEV